MKKLAFAFALVFVAISCNKNIKPAIKKDAHYVYYNDDFKNADMTLLGVETSEIDAVWFELYYNNTPCAITDQPDRYALIVKHNGAFTKELGVVASDWTSYIEFTTNNGTSYNGTLDTEKEQFTIAYDLVDRTEELTFKYKEK